MVATSSLSQTLRENGLKLTPQRDLICRLIENSDTHPSAESLHEQAVREMPTLSLKTVYTTLSELAQIGAIRMGRFGTGNMRVDTKLAPHAHLICSQCNRLEDVPLSTRVITDLHATTADTAFEIEGCDVLYYGRCASCAHRSRQPVHHAGKV